MTHISALGSVGQPFTVGRPAVQVERGRWGLLLWVSRRRPVSINHRTEFGIAAGTAQAQHFPVEGKYMVVVVMFDKIGVQNFRFRWLYQSDR